MTPLIDGNLSYSQALFAQLYCYDQEPLNFALYQHEKNNSGIKAELVKHGLLSNISENIRTQPANIYDKCLLLHSEKQSANVQLYKDNNFIPVYYWAHGLIALDWFRYAQHITIEPSSAQKHFLIYNRAWAGTREYRIKFTELLQKNKLASICQTSFNPIDPENNCHFFNHVFANTSFIPETIDDVFPETAMTSSSSADFVIEDYANTKIEVVLETLFDDTRIHLTEKTLRPIACGQPFILASTANSLKYLREYGFKTFDSVIDESYDDEQNPVKRLELIIATMKDISLWEHDSVNWNKLNQIADYNRQHFFSNNFFNLLVSELKSNLQTAFDQLEDTNTGKNFIEIRKLYTKLPEEILTPLRNLYKQNSKEFIPILIKARGYYNRYLKSVK